MPEHTALFSAAELDHLFVPFSISEVWTTSVFSFYLCSQLFFLGYA